MSDGVASAGESPVTAKASRLGVLRASVRRSRHHVIYVGSTLLPVFGGFAITPALTRMLSAQDYGRVAQAGLVVQNVGLALCFGLGAQIHLVTVHQGPAWGRALVIRSSAAAVALGVSAMALLGLLGAQETYPVLFLATAGGIVMSSVTNVLVLLRALHRSWAYLMASLVVSVLAPLAGIASLLLRGLSWTSYLPALYGVYAVALATAALSARGETRGRPGLLRASLRVALPTLPHQLALYVLPLLLVSTAARVGGLERAAELQLGLLLGSTVGLAVGALNSAWMPVVLSANPINRRGVADRLALKMFWLIAAIGICVQLAAPLLVQLVAPPHYDRAWVLTVARLSALAGFFTGVYFANSHHIQSAGATRSLAVLTPGLSALALALGLLGWHAVGANPALTLVLANGLIAAAFHTLSRRSLGYAVHPRTYLAPGGLCLLAALLPLVAQERPVIRLSLGLGLLIVCLAGLVRSRRRASHENPPWPVPAFNDEADRR